MLLLLLVMFLLRTFRMNISVRPLILLVRLLKVLKLVGTLSILLITSMLILVLLLVADGIRATLWLTRKRGLIFSVASKRKKKSAGRPKLKTGERGVYQYSLFSRKDLPRVKKKR